MSAKINDAVVATIHQQFMAGANLRELAREHGVALRTLATRSKEGGWAAARNLQQSATAVPALIQAADRRVEAVAAQWHDRLSDTLDRASMLALQCSQVLARQDLSRLDVRELVMLLKHLVGTMVKLKVLLPQPSQARRKSKSS